MKMTGAQCLADMLAGYGVTHVFMVPAVVRRTFVEMERRTKIKRTELAALASDTWGCEVRPNETEPGINQPWHWITIPIMGLTVGEIFHLTDLAKDCAEDKRYEFLFVAPALPITGAVGSPTNPLAIK